MKYLLMATFCLCCASCSTILNSSRTDVYVYSQKPVTVTHETESSLVDSTSRMHIRVRRSEKLLNITASNDSITKDIYISPRLSPTFFMGFFFFPYTLFDFASQKRYKYPNEIVLNDDLLIKTKISSKEKSERMKLDQRLGGKHNALKLPQKGDFFANMTLPFVLPSQTLLSPREGINTSRGSFLGFGLGLEYYYKDNRFINLNSSVTFGGDFQIGCGDWGYDDETRFDVYNITLSHNHRLERLSFGYGLSYMYNDWWRYEYKPKSLLDEYGGLIDPNSEPAQYYEAWRYSTLGLALNSYYILGRGLSVGLTYRPQFFRLSSNMPSRFKYEHQISLDFSIKIGGGK